MTTELNTRLHAYYLNPPTLEEKLVVSIAIITSVKISVKFVKIKFVIVVVQL